MGAAPPMDTEGCRRRATRGALALHPGIRQGLAEGSAGHFNPRENGPAQELVAASASFA